MAQVILLTEVSGDFVRYSRYMGPYVLASQLEKAGYDVVVIDYFTQHENFFEYLDSFIDEKTLFIGLSTTFLTTSASSEFIIQATKLENFYTWFNELRVMSTAKYEDDSNQHLHLQDEKTLASWFQEIKEKLTSKSPSAKLILGGVKAKYFLNKKHYEKFAIDFLSLSTAEHGLVGFANKLLKSEEPDHYVQNGYKIIDNKFDVENKHCPETVLSSKFAIQPKEALPIEISRGCVFNCKFCNYDKKESFKKDLNILKQELIRNYELFGTTVYHFCDDCFNDSRKKVEDVCYMILGLPFKIEWISYARPDVGIKFPETMDLMIESGASGLFFGIESFNYDAVRRAGKGIHPDVIKEFLKNNYAKYSDRCLFQSSFIVGLPDETVASQEETINWVTKNHCLDFLVAEPLRVLHFEEKLDGILVDFSEHSRSPEKYSLTQLGASKNEWSHPTMNSRIALKLANKFKLEWLKSGHNVFMMNMWEYTILRSIGFAKSEVFTLARDEEKSPEMTETAFKRYNTFISSYHLDLKKMHS